MRFGDNGTARPVLLKLESQGALWEISFGFWASEQLCCSALAAFGPPDQIRALALMKNARFAHKPLHKRAGFHICRFLGAGWSSPVARQAHNLKVVGSNPTPATNS